MNNFTPAQPSECVIDTVHEIANTLQCYRVMISYGQAIDNEMIATEVVEKVINNLKPLN